MFSSKKIVLGMVLLMFGVCGFAQSSPPRDFIDSLDYLGVVLDREGYHTWGTSVVQGDDGKFHMYACQWSVEHGFGKWHKESMVNYFIADKPEGPYTFVKTIVSARPGGDVEGVWNRYTAHNPEVKRIDDYYVLTYISYPKIWDIPNAKIGMKVSTSPEGPWKDVGENGLVMNKSETEGMPSCNSKRGTDNPSLVKYRGKYYLFFMYNPGPGDNTSLGVAVSDSLFGPYQEQKTPVLLPGKKKKVEDLCVYLEGDSVSAVMCDNFGIYTPNGGIYCQMDQPHFDKTGDVKMIIKSIAWETRDKMFPEADFSKGKNVYGGRKFERPKILIIDDKPAYMFLPSGFNAKGDARTVLHLFKIKPEAIRSPSKCGTKSLSD